MSPTNADLAVCTHAIVNINALTSRRTQYTTEIIKNTMQETNYKTFYYAYPAGLDEKVEHKSCLKRAEGTCQKYKLEVQCNSRMK